MEVAGIVVGVVGLAGLFKTALEAWEFVDAGRAHAENFSFFRTRLDNQRAIFLIWAETMGFFSHDGYNKALDTPMLRVNQVVQTLSHIELLFSDTDRLIDEYGFKVQKNDHPGQEIASPAIFETRYVRLKALVLGQRRSRNLLAEFRAKIRRDQKTAGTWRKFKWSIKDEKKSTVFLEKISSLVDDLEKLTRDIPVTKTKTELASEAVAEVSESSLVELEESSKDRATIISSAASVRLRSIEGRTIATVTTATGTFVTAETHPLQGEEPARVAPTILDTLEEDKTLPLDFQLLEIENQKAAAAIVAQAPAPATPWSPDLSDDEIANRRLLGEMRNWIRNKNPNGWFTISVVQDSDLRKFLGTFKGPSDTPYEGGIFHVRMNINEGYPEKPPTVWFLTKILHPNIDSSGAICMDILSDFRVWSPVLTLEKLLVSVASILSSPNWEEPVDNVFPMEMHGGIGEFNLWARLWTKAYARGDIVYPGERTDGFSTVCSDKPLNYHHIKRDMTQHPDPEVRGWFERSISYHNMYVWDAPDRSNTH